MNSLCKLWDGPKFKDGYGRMGLKLAHRVVFAAANGPIPKNLIVRHSCDNKLCINLSHLSLGTQADNVNDKVLRNRQAKGTQANKSKLTNSDVLAIKSSLKSQVTLGQQFGVTQSMISRIKANKNWKHI